MSHTNIFVLGTSHWVAGGDVRERLHVDTRELFAALARLIDRDGALEEAVPLVTCGRFEVYGVSEDPDHQLLLLQRLMARRTGLSAERLKAHSYVHRDADAVVHLCRVAAGLDSVVHGEAQILGQVREAYHTASAEGTLSTSLHRLFQTALLTGKRVRSETEIGRGAASVASAALRVLQRDVGSLEPLTALVLGAGETGSLVARLLKKTGVGRLLLTNRSQDRAVDLGRALGAVVEPMTSLTSLIERSDIVVGTLASSPHVVTTATMASVASPPSLAVRHFLDLAHPRNFDPGLETFSNVRLIDLEHVFERVAAARRKRAEQVPQAERIVNEEAARFDQWLRTRASVPTLRAVRAHALRLAESEADRYGRGRNPAEQKQLRRVARSIARSLLHPSTVALRGADPATPEGRALLDSAVALFGVPDESQDSLESP